MSTLWIRLLNKRRRNSKGGWVPNLPRPPTAKTLGHGQTLKLHLKKAALGEGWATIPPKDDGPNVGKPYKTPRHQQSTEVAQAGRSPLTDELLALGKDLTTVLDEYDIPGEQELAQAMSSILPRMDSADVEMEEVNVAMGFEPRSAIQVMMSTSYDIQMALRQGPLPQLWHRKIRCWMRILLSRPQEPADREQKKTLVIPSPKGSNAPGSSSPHSAAATDVPVRKNQ